MPEAWNELGQGGTWYYSTMRHETGEARARRMYNASVPCALTPLAAIRITAGSCDAAGYYLHRVELLPNVSVHEPEDCTMTWQPICLDAPTDRPVDLWVVAFQIDSDGHVLREGRRVPDCEWWQEKQGWRSRRANTLIERIIEGGRLIVTHWMPIPEGPEAD